VLLRRAVRHRQGRPAGPGAGAAGRFGLAEAARRKFGGYSKGMKRKLTIAAGIIHKPPILFLDEPTTGIDVASARQMRQLIADLNRGGTTIFLTTHYIEEAERLCERIAFIVSGRIVRTDTVEHLIQPIQGSHVVQIACADPQTACRLTSR
jgi:ABC-2 type transport system ATP-binding protein